MKKTANILLILIITPIFLSAQYFVEEYLDLHNPTNNFIFEQWTTDNGLPQNSINSIMQSEDHYMWFATFNGLVRFDGHSFKIFTSENTRFLKTNRIIKLLQDNENRMWITSEDNNIFRRDGEEVVNLREKFNIREDFTYMITTGIPGEIYITSYNKAFRYFDDTITEITFDNYFTTGSILNVFTDIDSTTYFCFGDITLTYKDGVIEHFKQGGSVGYYKIFRDSRNKLWFAGEKGLYYLENNKIVPVEELNNRIKVSVIEINEDENGVLWIGTATEGLYFIKNDQLFKFNQPGFQYSEITSIFRDIEGNMWVGTKTQGLLKFREKAIFFLLDFPDYQSNSICPISQLEDGSIVIGGACSGLTILKNSTIRNLNEEQGLVNTCVWSLLETSAGDLYVGTFGGGIYLFDRYQERFYNLKQIDDYAIFSIIEDRAKNIWFGGIKGVYKMRGDNIVHFDTTDGLAGLDTKQVYEASNGDIWFASTGGVSKWDGKQFTKLTQKDGLSHQLVRSIYEDEFQRMWFGTYGGGLNVYDGEIIVVLDKDSGLESDIVSAIIEDDYGRIWFTSNTALSSVAKEDVFRFIEGKSDVISCVKYLKSDGLNVTEFNGGFSPSGLKATDGTIWFPTINGVTIVKPDRLKKSTKIAKLLIEEVEIDSLIIENPTNITIDPDFDRIEIKYTSLSFRSPHNVKFRTKLEGIDENWSEETSARSIYYNYLPSGNYTFKLMGTNSDGVWSDEVKSFSLTIKARFYETFYFYFISFIVLLAIISLIYYYRIVSLRKQAKLLEEMVNSKTRDLRKEKLKLEELLVEVGDAKEKIELQNNQLEELNSAKDTFFSVISHDLKNPFNALLGYTEFLLSGYDEMEEDEVVGIIEDIKSTSRATYNLLANLLEWANSQTGNLEISIQKTDLYEIVKENVLVVTSSARQKNITINFDHKPMSAYCDETSISTVVRNIISNSIKFTPRDGFIDVRLDESETQCFVMIRDTGIGMELQKVTNLFKLEGRRSTLGTEKEAGTGLGLIIAKEFVDKNGGSISVTSEPGKGTEFIITLPKAN
ncbi:MAG: hybrid sensor histidine kinase/response regulator [Melioribacteraceae bacterium]|nr:MAG: hybrid sensor histidine kinase/response regulator [Melioribacteraceae bacterium]